MSRLFKNTSEQSFSDLVAFSLEEPEDLGLVIIVMAMAIFIVMAISIIIVMAIAIITVIAIIAIIIVMAIALVTDQWSLSH